MRFFIGGYGPHLYMAWLDTESGALDLVDSVTTPANASFLTCSRRYHTLYACVETAASGKGVGRVVAYRMDERDRLTAVGAAESCGDAPCHLVVSEAHDIVAVANYMGGSVGIIGVHADGTLGEPIRCIEHEGSGPNKKRQDRPHPHGVTLSPDGNRLYVCDLGTDQVICYDPLSEADRMAPTSVTNLSPGSGPRHMCFHEGHAYLVNELSSTVCVFDVDADTGTLSQLQEVSTLPADYSAGNAAAEIVLHPSGQFVYVSNRGHDSVAVFARDGKTGRLGLTGHFDATGPTPRHLAIDPTGRWCLVAVQDGDFVSSFALDEKSGIGHYSDSVVRITAPSCIAFSK